MTSWTESGNRSNALPRVDVVIVNWNSGSQLAECLQSIGKAANDAALIARTIVVDNASTDRSLDEALPAAGPLPLQIIRNAENRGFAAASNQGAAGSEADFILFLNPDTRLFPGSIAEPCRFLADPSNRAVGIAGIQLVDAGGGVTRSCARFPTPTAIIGAAFGLDRLLPTRFPPHFLPEREHAETRLVDQVMGAFFLIRRELFVALGGFDERFFVYYEDMDLALRARERGMTSAFLATARAFHRGRGTSEAVRDRRLFYFLRSRLLYALKHFRPAGALAVITATLVVEPWTRMAAAVVTGRLAEVPEIVRGFVRLYAALPGIRRTHVRASQP